MFIMGTILFISSYVILLLRHVFWILANYGPREIKRTVTLEQIKNREDVSRPWQHNSTSTLINMVCAWEPDVIPQDATENEILHWMSTTEGWFARKCHPADVYRHRSWMRVTQGPVVHQL